MTSRTLASALACLACLGASSLSLAQERGRTDGPEGSEYGKGGYVRSSGSRAFSLQLDWGASLQERGALGGVDTGAPLFGGVTASFWGDEWFLIEASGAYLVNNGRVNVLVGPRFRAPLHPVGLSAGLQAGAVVIPDHGLRFALSPKVGADLLIDNRYLLGLTYAFDLAFGGNGTAHRFFLSLGYRF